MKKLRSINRPVSARIAIPGSKSITNRALLLAALASGRSILLNALISDDSVVFANALQTLGVDVVLDVAHQSVTVTGCLGDFPNKKAEVWCQDAGTAARFLLAACAANAGEHHFTGTKRLSERPMGDLIMALQQLGARVDPEATVCFPCVIRGTTSLKGGEVVVAGSKSSQFVSALLMVAPLMKRSLTVKVEGLARRAYIELTCDMMSAFNVTVLQEGDHYTVPAGQHYRPLEYVVEPDLSTASYFFAAAAVTGGQVTIPHLQRDKIKQGDGQFLGVLERMGCVVMQNNDSLVVQGPLSLTGGFEVDMQNFSDPFMTLACVAPFADAPIKITGIAHTRLQESDRISAIASELEKLGVTVATGEDWIEILPGMPIAAEVDSHHDHRVAMSLALVGLRVPGLTLTNAGCVAKTCPDFFELWSLL